MCFKKRACCQLFRKVYHHWLLQDSGIVNKVRGIEKEIFANNWRQKYPNGTLSWKRQREDIFYSVHAFASVVLQYHSKALYSFEVGNHKFEHHSKP